MKRNLKYLMGILVFSMLLLFVSCDETGDDNPGATSIEDMAGDWYVTTFINGSQLVGYKLITTYNTAANVKNEMWVNDNKNIWQFKAKSTVDYANKTFSGTKLASKVGDYEITVNITDGKILKGQATTTGGNPSDSIHFNIEFSDDPGNVYTIAGYKRTGFAEDEH